MQFLPCPTGPNNCFRQVYVPLPNRESIEEMLPKFWNTMGNFQDITPSERKHLAKIMVQNKYSGEDLPSCQKLSVRDPAKLP